MARAGQVAASDRGVPVLVPPERAFRWSQVAPATAPGTITAPMAINQVRRANTTPIVP
jgi:hypothetical protein